MSSYINNVNKNKGRIIVSIISFLSASSFFYRTYSNENRNPLEAIKAYEAGNCDLAIDYSNKTFKSRRFFKVLNNYSETVKNIKKECLSFLVNKKEANLKIKKQDYVGALREYDNFLAYHRDSYLTKFIPTLIEKIFSQSSPKKVANSEVCLQIYDLRENGTIQEKDIIFPLFHWHCGEQSYQRAECKQAIQHLDKIISLETFSSYYSKGQSIKEECKVFIVKNEEAIAFEKSNKLGKALVKYDEFLNVTHVDNQGPLASATRRSAELLFAKNGPAKLASSSSCEKTDSFINNEIIPNQDSNLPHLYWSCSKIYIENGDYSKEIDTHVDFLNRYSKHELSLKVQSAVLKNFVTCNRHNELQENEIIAKLPNLMPAIYLTCGKAYQEVVNYPQAIEFFSKFDYYYPNHSLIKTGSEYILDLEQEIKLIKQEMLIATNTIQNRIIACSAGNIFLGIWIDIGELISGKDCMTGKELSSLEHVLNVVPLGDVFKGASHTKKLKNLVDTLELTLSIQEYHDIKKTQDLLETNEKFFALLNNIETLQLLALNNDNLTELVLQRKGKPIDLSRQHSTSVKLIDS